MGNLELAAVVATVAAIALAAHYRREKARIVTRDEIKAILAQLNRDGACWPYLAVERVISSSPWRFSDEVQVLLLRYVQHSNCRRGVLPGFVDITPATWDGLSLQRQIAIATDRLWDWFDAEAFEQVIIHD